MVERAPAPKGRVALCPRSTATSVAASSRTSRPSSTGRRVPVPSSRCRIPRPVPARHRLSTSIRPFLVVRRRIRRRTAKWPEKEQWLQLYDILRCGALLGLHDLELHALAFSQRLEPFSLNRRVMYEAVLAAVFGGDEAEALRIVEPLHGTRNTCHLSVTP